MPIHFLLYMGDKAIKSLSVSCEAVKLLIKVENSPTLCKWASAVSAVNDR